MKARVGIGQPGPGGEAHRDQRVVDETLAVFEEPAEDEAREDEGQRPRQQKPEPHRPLDSERLVREQRQAKADDHRAGHGDEDEEEGVQRRFEKALVAEGAGIILETDEGRAHPGLRQLVELEARDDEIADRIDDDRGKQDEGGREQREAEPPLGALEGREGRACSSRRSGRSEGRPSPLPACRERAAGPRVYPRSVSWCASREHPACAGGEPAKQARVRGP